MFCTLVPLNAVLAQGTNAVDDIINAIDRNETVATLGPRIRSVKNIEAQSSQGYTLLMSVARAVPERMDLLPPALERKPDVNARTSRGESALILASGAGNANMTRALIAAGADLEARSSDWGSALTLSAINGRWPVVEILLAAGAKANVPDAYGRTPLHSASIARRWDVVAALVQKGADPNVVDNVSGDSPLMWAASYGNIEAVKLLVSRKADPNLRNPHMCTTALHSAVYGGNEDVLKFLLGQGAQAGAADRNGKTALGVAIANRRDSAASLLRAAGAPETGTPVEFCTFATLPAQQQTPTAGVDVPARLRAAAETWQTAQLRFLDPKIIALLLQDEELFRLTLCMDGEIAAKCTKVFNSQQDVAAIVKAYLDDRLIARKSALRTLAARFSDSVGVQWSRTAWPEEVPNFDVCLKLPSDYSTAGGFYLDGEKVHPINSLANNLCLLPGQHRILAMKTDKTWKLLDVELSVDSTGPKLRTTEQPGKPFVVSNLVTDRAVRPCPGPSEAKLTPLKQGPARDLVIEKRSDVADAFSVVLEIRDPANRCPGNCRALLGRAFLEALLQWAEACRLCSPSNFAIVRFDNTVFVDYSRITLGGALRSPEDMNKLLERTRAFAIRQYQEFGVNSATGKMMCDERAPQFIRENLCGAPRPTIGHRRTVVLELQEGDLICGKSSDSLVACASDTKVQLNTKYMSFAGLNELIVTAGKLDRRPTVIGAGTRILDLRTVLMHEVGHFFGLPHSDESSQDVMAQYYNEAGACMTSGDNAMVNNAVNQLWPYRLISCGGLRLPRP